MQKKITLLILLLLVQSGLVAYVYRDKLFKSPVNQKTVLLEIDIDSIDRVELDSGSVERVVLKKKGDAWILPDYSSLPVSNGVVAALLKDLTQAKISMPVALSESASKRFKVNNTYFNKKLTLYKKNKILARILIGKPLSYQTHYVRLENDNRIYTIKINMDRLPAEQKNWFDHQIIQPVLPLVRLESVDFILEKIQGEWQMKNAKEGDRLNHNQVTRLLNYIKFIQVIDVVDTYKPGEKPVFYFMVTDKKGGIRYDFYKKGKQVIVKSSRSNLYYQLAEYLGKYLPVFNKRVLVSKE